MKFATQKFTTDIEACDIPTVAKMNLTEYSKYIESHLIFSDSRGIVRATQGEYPLACTKAQLQSLIDFLQGNMDLLEP